MPNPPVSPQSQCRPQDKGDGLFCQALGVRNHSRGRRLVAALGPQTRAPWPGHFSSRREQLYRYLQGWGCRRLQRGSQGGKEQKREMHMGLQPPLHVRNVLEQRVGPRTGPESPALPTPGCVPGQPGCERCPVFCFFRLALGYLASLWEGGKMEKTP